MLRDCLQTIPNQPLETAHPGEPSLLPWVAILKDGAYSAGVDTAGDAFLVSPSRLLEDDGTTLAFEHFYSLENQLDGAVLEASLDGGAWFDLLESAAVVTSGGYNGTITGTTGNQASISGRNAWTGRSGGFVTTSIDLPDAWLGQSIRFRWYLAHNDGGAELGWFINSVLLNADTNFICDPFRPTVTLSTAATNLTEGDSSSTADLLLSTSLPLSTPIYRLPFLSLERATPATWSTNQPLTSRAVTSQPPQRSPQ